MPDPQSPQAPGADGVLVLPLGGGPALIDRLRQVAQEEGVRVVVLDDAPDHVIAGSTRNPPPSLLSGAVPAAGDGCRVEPGMTPSVLAGSTRNPPPAPPTDAVPATGDGCRVEPGMTPSVIAGSTRNPSPAAPAGAVPATGNGCRGEPGMTSSVMEALDAVPQPVVASLAADCDAATTRLLAACDIVLAADTVRFTMDGGETIDAAEAERRGLVTLAVAAGDLAHETESLLRELAAKDPDALRLTKDTLRSVASVPWPDIVAWNSAKVTELKTLRAGKPSPQDLAVQSFLAGRSKPGLGT